MRIQKVIDNIKKEIRQLEDEISERQNRLDQLNKTLEILNSYENPCEECYGTGKIFCRSCAEDEGNYYTCSKCNGTGVK